MGEETDMGMDHVFVRFRTETAQRCADSRTGVRFIRNICDGRRALVRYIKQHLNTGVGRCEKRGDGQHELSNEPIYNVSNTTVNQRGFQLIKCLTHWRKSQL